MAVNVTDLFNKIQELTNETVPNSITPTRLGGILNDTTEYVSEQKIKIGTLQETINSVQSELNVITNEFNNLFEEI